MSSPGGAAAAADAPEEATSVSDPDAQGDWAESTVVEDEPQNFARALAEGGHAAQEPGHAPAPDGNGDGDGAAETTSKRQATSPAAKAKNPAATPGAFRDSDQARQKRVSEPPPIPRAATRSPSGRVSRQPPLPTRARPDPPEPRGHSSGPLPPGGPAPPSGVSASRAGPRRSTHPPGQGSAPAATSRNYGHHPPRGSATATPGRPAASAPARPQPARAASGPPAASPDTPAARGASSGISGRPGGRSLSGPGPASALAEQGASFADEGSSTIDEYTTEDGEGGFDIASSLEPGQALPLGPTADSRGSLVIVAGNDRGRELDLSGETVVVGRGTDSDFVLTDIAASRRHAELRFFGGGYQIRDLGSGNGTLVNDVFQEEPCPVRDGDRIELGNTVMRLDHPATREQAAAGVGAEGGWAGPQAAADSVGFLDEESTLGGPDGLATAPEPAAARARASLDSKEPVPRDAGHGLVHATLPPIPPGGTAQAQQPPAISAEHGVPPAPGAQAYAPAFHRDGPAPPPPETPAPAAHPSPPGQDARIGLRAPQIPDYPRAGSTSAPDHLAAPQPPAGPEYQNVLVGPVKRGRRRAAVITASALGAALVAGTVLALALGGDEVAVAPEASPEGSASGDELAGGAEGHEEPAGESGRAAEEGESAPATGGGEQERAAGSRSESAAPAESESDPDPAETAPDPPDPPDPDDDGAGRDRGGSGDGDGDGDPNETGGDPAGSEPGHESSSPSFEPVERTLPDSAFGTDEAALVADAQMIAELRKRAEAEQDEEERAQEQRDTSGTSRQQARRTSAAERAQAAADEAMATAEGQYEQRDFSAAADTLRTAAADIDGRAAQRLRQRAGGYEQLGDQYQEGLRTRQTSPSVAFVAFQEAHRIDAQLGGAHGELFGAQLRVLAPRAAGSYMANGRYAAAKSAADTAAQFGAGSNQTVQRVRSALAQRAESLYQRARSLRSSDPEEAVAMLREVQSIVPADNPWHERAQRMLAARGAD